MAWTVGEVRTLHHHDSIGLLGPSDRSEAGYRLYEMADLEHLQQALFLKQLGFSLEEIRAIMLDPSFDRAEALRAQRALPAWNGKNPATGKRAPYAANYGWTLTVTKNGQTATKTGGLLLSNIYYQAKGTSAGGHAVLARCYLQGKPTAPGSVHFYISASSSAASDQLALRITRTGGYAASSSSMPWRLPVPSPAPKTPNVSGASGIKGNGIYNIYITGRTNVTYAVSVIE